MSVFPLKNVLVFAVSSAYVISTCFKLGLNSTGKLTTDAIAHRERITSVCNIASKYTFSFPRGTVCYYVFQSK